MISTLRSGVCTAILLVSAMCLSVSSSAEDRKPGAVLVELFTSEGCSSCPPADALLRKIDQKQTESGQLIVAISEHVDYWNQLGWTDPFSSHDYSERQSQYAEKFHLDSVYTPQMVINGERQVNGSLPSAVLQAIRATDHGNPVVLQISSAQWSEKGLDVAFSASGNLPSSGVDIFAVIADDTDTSSVSRGENSGRTLTHVSVARSLVRITSLRQPGEQKARVPLSNRIPRTKMHLILFAQARGLGPIMGVAIQSI